MKGSRMERSMGKGNMQTMKGEVISVCSDTLLGHTVRMKNNGYRLITMTCAEVDERSFHILYHFDKGMGMKHLRLPVPRGCTVPSISQVYYSSFLVENEIQDQFGILFDGLVIDYKRTLYLDGEATDAPFCRYGVSRKKEQEPG